MHIFLNTSDAYKKLHTYRNSLISTEDPGITPGTTEALKYLVFSQICNTQPQQTIKKDEELLRLKATIRKRKRKVLLRFTVIKQTKGEGWREIGKQQVWFENPWHANYARFLDKAYDIVSHWLYKPERIFKIGPIGYYTPTFWVRYVKGGSSFVEIDAYKEDVNIKADLLSLYYPEESVFILDRERFLKQVEFFRFAINGWE